MTSYAFDTLKFAQRLEKAGFPHDQAVALAEAQQESLAEIADIQFATKNDIQGIKNKLIEHDGQFMLVKWMLGVLLAGVTALVLKAFF